MSGFSMSPDLPEPRSRLSAKEGWAEFVRYSPPEKPKFPTDSEWERMSDRERRTFDGRRRRWHDTFGPVETPAIRDLLPLLVERVLSNLGGTSGARPGAVIDGSANLGKTTLLKYVGRWYERLLRAEYEAEMQTRVGAEWHPVVYNTLTAQTTVKALNRGLANFYGAVVPSRPTTQQLTEIVVEHAQACATTLFLIDDIHYLDMRHEGAREVNNHLKMLASETSATFLYAGINCEETGLLTEGQPAFRNRAMGGRKSFGQTRGRFAHMRLEPFGKGSKQKSRDWVGLVMSFERELVLRRAHGGMCSEIHPYLFERTKGYVGALSNLLRWGAALAIARGTEAITKGLLDEIQLDYASETG